MSEIYYDVDGNTVKARFKNPWVGKFSAELLRLGICVPLKLKVSLFHMNYVEYGKAKCHPDDKFDLEYGKKLARKRLMTKYNRMRYLFFRELDKYMASCRSITSAKRDKYYLASEGDYHA